MLVSSRLQNCPSGKTAPEKIELSIYKYINIYYITFSVSTFGFCKVHFYSCYIMWKTYADLFKGKKVSTLLFESIFLFLVFILTSDRTTAIWGPFGNGLVCKRKFIIEQCFVNPSPAPRHLTKTKSHKEHPFFKNFIMCIYSEPLAPILTIVWPYQRVTTS